MRKLFLSPSYTSNLYGVVIDGLAGGKLWHAKAYAELKYPKVIAGSLLPLHAYLMLPVSHIMHQFPLLSYKLFV